MFGGDVVVSGSLYDAAGALIGGGGWSDDGTVVRLTTSTDNVGIGTSFSSPTIGQALRPNLQVDGSTILGSDEYGAAYPPTTYGKGTANIRWLPEDESSGFGRSTRVIIEKGNNQSSGSLLFKRVDLQPTAAGTSGLTQENPDGSGTDDFTLFSSGANATIHIKAGTNLGVASETFRTVANIAGSVFNENAQDYDFRVESSNRPGAIWVDSSKDQVSILSGGNANSPNEVVAPDVSLFISGSAGSRGTAVRGTSVFGGDVVISGSLTDGNGNPITGGGGGASAVGWLSLIHI